MFHDPNDDNFTPNVFGKWYLLSFLAGCVNAGAFLAAGSFVTHVTGFATLFGVKAADGRPDEALGFLAVPLFFLLGSGVSAWLVDRRYHRGRRPHYDWVMGLVFLCLTAVALGGHYHWFGEFGSAVRLREDFVFLALLCMASGLQNAAISTSSGTFVRTTHLTGLTTDLGIGLVRVLSMSRGNFLRKKEIRANLLRLGTIVAFGLGSVAGALSFMRYEYLGFLLPATIALYAVSQARRDQRRRVLHQH